MPKERQETACVPREPALLQTLDVEGEEQRKGRRKSQKSFHVLVDKKVMEMIEILGGT